MKSLESRIAERIDLAKKHSKGSEAAAIIAESPGKFLERKLHELEILTKPFMESFQESAGATNALVESYQKHLGFSLAEARVAAGISSGPDRNNGGTDWEAIVKDIKEGK